MSDLHNAARAGDVDALAAAIEAGAELEGQVRSAVDDPSLIIFNQSDGPRASSGKSLYAPNATPIPYRRFIDGAVACTCVMRKYFWRELSQQRRG
jgi:hypothetical protein